MRWDTYEPDLVKRVALAPGGTALADHLIKALAPEPGQRMLDICPGAGVLASVIARELGVQVTCVAPDAATESAAEAGAAALGVSESVTVIPAVPTSLPLPSERFECIYCVAGPSPLTASSELIRELHRVLVPDGQIGLAGPAGLSNDPPDYMLRALNDIGEGVSIRTPAYTGLLFAREGFHIVTAEYVPDPYEHWLAWLDAAPEGFVSDALRQAIIEDEGRWLSLGLVVVSKPPKPTWAV